MPRPILTRSATSTNLLFLQLLLLLCWELNQVNGLSHMAYPMHSYVEALSRRSIAPGDRIPDVSLNWGFNPISEVNMKEYTADQSVIILGVPAAFTNNKIVPTFLDQQTGLKQLGINNVIVYSTNDSAVVGIWNKQLVEAAAAAGRPNSLVTFFGDPSGAFTKACGMELEQTAELTHLGLFDRCKPFALYAENGVIKDLVMDETKMTAPFVIQRIRNMKGLNSKKT